MLSKFIFSFHLFRKTSLIFSQKMLLTKKRSLPEEESDTGYNTVEFENQEDYQEFQKTGKLIKKVDQLVSKSRQSEIKRSLVIPTTDYKTSYCRSQGPGGQHVNKTDSKAVVNWNVMKSTCVNEATKRKINLVHFNKINKDGDLIISCQDSREQNNNLVNALENLKELISESYCEEGVREIQFKKQSPENENNRIRSKKMHGEKKKRRTNMDD